MSYNTVSGDELAAHVAPLRTLPQTVATLLQERRRALAAIAANDRVSDKVKEETRAAAEAIARAELADARQRADAARAAFARDLAAVRRPPMDPARAVLVELEHQRTWAQFKGVLDAGTPWTTLVQEAGQSGDGTALAVLGAELPAYLRAQADPAAATVRAVIDTAARPLLPPGQAAAADLAAELERGYTNVTTAIRYAEYELSGGALATVLPGWAAGTVVDVV